MSITLCKGGFLFHFSNQLLERLRLVHSQVSQYFAVQVYAFSAQFTYKLGVAHTLFAAGSIDTCYPQSAVFTFFQLTAYIFVAQTFLQYVFGNGIYVFTLAVKTFGLI